ncbi:MAG: hypothetical protein ABI640_05550 [Gammaproteobacteria bacterium]
MVWRSQSGYFAGRRARLRLSRDQKCDQGQNTPTPAVMQDLGTDKLLLLQAAFATGAQAETAWRLWQDRVPLDEIDAESQRTVPQLHLNMAADTSVDSRVQGLYRRAWYSNTLLLEQVRPLLDRLKANGVRAVASKQTAAVVKARACYPLDRFHLLVADREVEQTMVTLREMGWVSARPPAFAEAALRGIEFTRSGFLVQLSCAPAQDNGFFSRVERVESDAGMFEVPGHTDQLLEAAAPERMWHYTSMYQRLLETLIAIRFGKQEPDWSAVARIGATAGSTLPLADTLEYLARDFAVALPDGYLAALRHTPLVTPRQEEEYRLKRGAPSLWRRIRLSRLEYRSLKRLSAARNESLSLVEYLKLRWNVSDMKGIVKHVVSLAKK